MPDFPPPPKLDPNRTAGRPGGLVLTRRRPPGSLRLTSDTPAPTETGVPVFRTATPRPISVGLEGDSEVARTLRAIEARLAERERAVEELETRLHDREREISEMEALLRAREKVLYAQGPAGSQPAATPQEMAAMLELKEELKRQEEILRETRAALKEREAFLEESENKLFEKVQSQQEKETELEQREEDLRERERRFRELEAARDPAAAAALAAEKSRPREFDEFSE